MNAQHILLASMLVLAHALSAHAVASPAGAVRDIFQQHCFDCHGGKRSSAGVKILDRDLLVKKNKIVPGKPAESQLLRLLTATDDSVMPPAERPRLTPDEIEHVRRWITAGAPPFPTTDESASASATKVTGVVRGALGAEYVLQSILQDVRRLAAEDRKHARYFSLVHLLNAGLRKEELQLQRDALAKAINHLTWKKALVKPTAVEPTYTVFRVDLRSLGWDRRPFRRTGPGREGQPSALNLFDLALLEYPYGIIHERSETYVSLLREYLEPADLARPIPYVRADWFVSVATQPPLYHDFLQLPHTLKPLEDSLGVDAAANVAVGRAIRGGVTTSGVSRNNRVVERHAAPGGYYWKSFDFATSSGEENIFRDPVNLQASGGEMVFQLPNGMQGYLIVDNRGQRIDAAPTSIVIDRHASDKTVRNGLACMRCHDRGMKGLVDAVRPAVLRLPTTPAFDRARVLRLYPEQAQLDAVLQADEDAFLGAMANLLGKPQGVEPLTPVSTRFLDERLSLAAVSAELGLVEPRGLKETFRLPQFVKAGLAPLTADERVARDTWEEHHGMVVRQLGVGVPVYPLDGMTHGEHEPDAAAFTLEVKTNRKGSVFQPGDDVVVFVKASKTVFIEVYSTSARGRQTVLAPSTTRLEAGKQFRFPPEGKSIKARGGAGQERITVFASEAPFPAGELLRGDGVGDRVVHHFPVRAEGRRMQIGFAPDPDRTVKKTIAIEVR